MKHLVLAAALAAGTAVPAQSAAAHARLKHAEPGAGATVPAPTSITLEFGEAVVPRLSGISLADAAGHPVQIGKGAGGAKAAILVAPISDKLQPGSYVVDWHAVATDTHRTQGTFRFTVAP